MRRVLERALTEVGARPALHSPLEHLAMAAAVWMAGRDKAVVEMQRSQAARGVRVRDALRRAGRDPGAHASFDSMLDEIIRVADGKVIR